MKKSAIKKSTIKRKRKPVKKKGKKVSEKKAASAMAELDECTCIKLKDGWYCCINGNKNRPCRGPFPTKKICDEITKGSCI